MNDSSPLDKLLEGNRRFISGERTGVSAAWNPEAMLAGQEPFAAVLGCSDSRVPPEQLFDLGPGEVFVVRVAGNIAWSSQLDSLEYAVSHLHVPLLLVLGHDDCGAVKAALGSSATDTVGDLIKHVRSAVEHVLKREKDAHEILNEAVRANVLRTMSDLVERSSVIAKAVRNGNLALVGALFSLESGEVSVLKIPDRRSER